MDSEAAQILEFLRAELLEEDQKVTVEESLFEGQILDSFSLTSLIAFLEDRFAIRVGALEVVLENFDSVAKTAEFVRRKRGA